MNPFVSANDPEAMILGRMFFAALEAAELTPEQVALLGRRNPQALQNDLRDLLTKFVLPDAYSGEEDVPKDDDEEYGYPSAYHPRTLLDQYKLLVKHFPFLGSSSLGANELRKPMRSRAEAEFLMPRWSNFASTYAEAVWIVLKKLRRVLSRRRKKLFVENIDRLQQTPEKTRAFARMFAPYPDDAVISIAAQFGRLHAGRSPRRAQAVMEESRQFGLGIFEVGIMLLTHIERLNGDVLAIDCSGDAVLVQNADGSSKFMVPSFAWCGRRNAAGEWEEGIVLLLTPPEGYSRGMGAVSGFIPISL